MSESGMMELRDDHAAALARALKVPVEFLLSAGTSLPADSLGLLRARVSQASKEELAQARALAAIAADLRAFLSQGAKSPPVRIPRLIDAPTDYAAEITRAAMGLSPDEPIRNLTARMEKCGVFVVGLAGLPPAIDGFCAWVAAKNGDVPIICFRKGMTAFRLRWTLAHELGHVVMSHEAFKGRIADLERETNDFAGELLLPASAIPNAIVNGTGLTNLAKMKTHWGLSMQSLVERLFRAGVYSDRQARRMRAIISDRGWKFVEPGDLSTPPEEPTLLRKLSDLKLPLGARSPSDVARASGLPPDAVDRILASDSQEHRFKTMVGEA